MEQLGAEDRPQIGECNLFGAHEQRMLDGMGKTWHVLRIAEASYVHIDSRAGFVGVCIMYQQRFELVGQLYDSILAIIKSWHFEILTQELDRSRHARKRAITQGSSDEGVRKRWILRSRAQTRRGRVEKRPLPMYRSDVKQE